MSSKPAVQAVEKLGLDALDKLQAEELVLFCAQDERPLLGAAGLVDWRVNGWLSRLIAGGVFGGQRQERLLTCGAQRVSAARIFVFGVGESRGFTHPVAAQLGEFYGDVLTEAGAQDVVLGIPGAGDRDAHAALFSTLSKKISAAKVTTWGPWHKI